jgi:Phage virion morphogenesis family
MPLQTIRFDVAGDVQYSRAFEAAAHEAEDLSEPLAMVGDAVLRDVFEQFRTEGTFGHGSKWKPLSPSYAEWKRQQVGDESILVFTGETRARMIARSAIHVSPRRMVYDPSAPEFALRHQQGDEADGLPQRKMVEIPETDRRQWDRYFVEWLNSIRREKLAGL